VTHLELRRVEADGTRVYSDYHRYTPMADEDRTNARRKPDDPRAVRFHGRWFVPLAVLDDETREMPETRPDEETLEHRASCRCDVCRRPEATVLWRRQAKRGSG
jgi:hypothetical protein